MVNQKAADLGIQNRFNLISFRFSLCFDAFSSREPASVSLENAMALVGSASTETKIICAPFTAPPCASPVAPLP
jgi:hypothetical protein